MELDDYPESFKGIGCLPGTYHIELADGATPVVHSPRKIPVPQREKVVEEMKRMERLGVIMWQEETTVRVGELLVVVQKPNGSVSLCIDPRHLNGAIKRSQYPMKTVDEVAHCLQGANTRWRVLVSMHPNTPIGHYRLTRLHFGVKCAPEIFQRTMNQMVEDLVGSVM